MSNCHYVIMPICPKEIRGCFPVYGKHPLVMICVSLSAADYACQEG